MSCEKCNAHPDRPCGCCEGVQETTPLGIFNRPGLKSISYRMGSYATFFESMLARLTSHFLKIEAPDGSDEDTIILQPLQKLKTRDSSDPAIALLDSWAVVSDVLTFYQERIVNEGFLRTAGERRSILELARLVGYRLRPGVAASVYLAFEIEKEQDFNISLPPSAPGGVETDRRVIVPAGTRAQSIPGPDEMPQSFETSHDLEARYVWNKLKPRLSHPPFITFENIETIEEVYFKGTETNLKVNDRLLFSFGDTAENQKLRIVGTVEPDDDNARTKVLLQDADQLLILLYPIVIKYLKIIDSGYYYSSSYEINAVNIINYLRNILNSEDNFSIKYYLLCFQSVELRKIITTFPRTRKSSLIFIINQAAYEIEKVLYNLRPPLLDIIDDIIDYLNTLIEPAPVLAIAVILQSTLLDILIDLKEKLDQATGMSHMELFRTLQSAIIELQNEGSDGVDDIITKLKEFQSCLLLEEGIKQNQSYPVFIKLQKLLEPLLIKPSLQPQNPLRRLISIKRTFTRQTDLAPQLLSTHFPLLRTKIYDAWEKTAVQPPGDLQSVQVFRIKVMPFGHNAPKEIIQNERGKINCYKECHLVGFDSIEKKKKIALSESYNEIKKGSWIIVKHKDYPPKFLVIEDVQTISKVEYGLSNTITELTLNDQWFNDEWIEEEKEVDENCHPILDDSKNFEYYKTISILRNTVIYTKPEIIALNEHPIKEDVDDDAIELNGLYDGLKAGRWIEISGERTDITEGEESDNVRSNELLMITGATQAPYQMETFDGATFDLPGDTLHTTLHLANKLAYRYKRDTVTINANVAHATHGETVKEVLGSGNSSEIFQQFTLKQMPLTYVSAITPAGIDTTLTVQVNDVDWEEAPSHFEMNARDRKYVTKRDNENNTSVIFGDGKNGTRLPGGTENIKAVYRRGIGKAGNVKAQQVSMLLSQPLGVKNVINPQPSGGGADAEDSNEARRNTPLALYTLNRAVSVADYADFSRAFTGIGKAHAIKLSNGRRQLIHITIAGEDNIPVIANSDIYRNLQQALYHFGDPRQPLQIDLRELLLMVVSASVKLLDGYHWEFVEPLIRSTMLKTFGFKNRDLGQDLLLGNVLSTIQAVEGVDYVDVDTLDVFGEMQLQETADLGDLLSEFSKDDKKQPRKRVVADLGRVDANGRILPAQLVMLSPDVPDTLLLKEIN